MNKVKAIFKAVVAGLVLIATASVSAAIEVQGHRGAAALRPENTLSGFDYALDLQVDTLELDLGVTKDGVLVVKHDQAINSRVCRYKTGKEIEGDLLIRELTLEQVKKFDCGSVENPRFPDRKNIAGESIPTLKDVFKLVKSSDKKAAKTVQFNIETKVVPALKKNSANYTEFVSKLVKLVKEFGFEERTVIQSFDHRILKLAKSKEPSIRTAALTGWNRPDYLSVIKASNADILSPNHLWIEASDVKMLHSAGVKVIPWTVNEPKDWQRLVDIGVDGIISDNPKGLLDWLKKKQLRK